MRSRPVAIVDIGSNSIKLLVARRGPDGRPEELLSRTIDARISAGIGGSRPSLTAEGMRRGVDAVVGLLTAARDHAPGSVALVATSAVRDAANRSEFIERIRTATGLELRVLDGNDEATLIGRGLASDPALANLADFYVFDLGGGSLECLALTARTARQIASLPLGCVRLLERFVSDPERPFSAESRAAVSDHVRTVIDESDFRFDLGAVAGVFAGGSMTTARAIIAARGGKSLDSSSPLIRVAELNQLLEQLAPLPLRDRRQVPGLPPARADVFPVALATMIAVADRAGLDSFLHSTRNLRWGLAENLLSLPAESHGTGQSVS